MLYHFGKNRGSPRNSSFTCAVPFFVSGLLLCGVSCGLSLFACSGGGREGQGCVSVGEVADSGELPARDDECGVLLIRQQLARMLGRLALAIGTTFTPDGAQGGRVTAGF
jgi:hypothetical protein